MQYYTMNTMILKVVKQGDVFMVDSQKAEYSPSNSRAPSNYSPLQLPQGGETQRTVATTALTSSPFGGLRGALKNNKIMEEKNFEALNQHVQLGGQAYYDERKYFMFTPDEPVPGMVPRLRRMAGVAQQMTDGTFDFVAQPRLRAKSTLIRKLAHGRVSRTKNGDVQLWLKISPQEQLNIGDTISSEAYAAAEAIREWQMKN